MYKRLIGTALVFGMAATAPPVSAQAQTLCGERTSITGTLKKKHGESILGLGLSGPNAVFEVWRAKRTGSWTITVTRPNNMTCILATGSNWVDDTREEPKTTSQASVTH